MFDLSLDFLNLLNKMRIGILADTHDNLPKTKAAVRFFNQRRVDYVMHAGDYVAPFAAVCLEDLSCDFCGVFGNNDGEKKGLKKISRGRIKQGPLRIELQNKRIVLVHDINTIDLKNEKCEIIIFGHTHKPEISKKGNLLLVNPGECAGWLSDCSSVVIFDLENLLAEISYI